MRVAKHSRFWNLEILLDSPYVFKGVAASVAENQAGHKSNRRGAVPGIIPVGPSQSTSLGEFYTPTKMLLARRSIFLTESYAFL